MLKKANVVETVVTKLNVGSYDMVWYTKCNETTFVAICPMIRMNIVILSIDLFEKTKAFYLGNISDIRTKPSPIIAYITSQVIQ